jgi:hypothetical protein
MLYTVTDGVQYRVPRQWAIDLWVAYKEKFPNPCNANIVLRWVPFPSIKFA